MSERCGLRLVRYVCYFQTKGLADWPIYQFSESHNEVFYCDVLWMKSLGARETALTIWALGKGLLESAYRYGVPRPTLSTAILNCEDVIKSDESFLLYHHEASSIHDHSITHLKCQTDDK
jgi:hypothetical protein